GRSVAIVNLPRAVSTADRAAAVIGDAATWRSSAPLNAVSVTAPSSATASSPATDATALLMPEATPDWCVGTALMTVVVNGATVMVMPTASTTIGARNVDQ